MFLLHRRRNHKKIITHIGIKKNFFLRITSLFVVDPGVLSQAELALTPILLNHQVTHVVQLQGAAAGGQDAVGPVAVAPLLIESFTDVGLGGGAIESQLLAKISMAAAETSLVAAAPAAGKSASLEESPPRLLLLVLAFAFVTAVGVVLVLSLRLRLSLHLALPRAPPRVPDCHKLGAVEERGLLDPGCSIGLDHVVEETREDCGLLQSIQLPLHVVVGLQESVNHRKGEVPRGG